MSDAVRKTVALRCPPEHAFRVFTERVDAWWPPSHRALGGRMALEPGVGGRLLERAGTQERVLGRVVEWAPPGRLAFAWRLGAPAEVTTLATVTFAPEGEGTRVDVVHVESVPRLPDWGRTATIFDRAWGHVLEALAAFTLAPPGDP